MSKKKKIPTKLTFDAVQHMKKEDGKPPTVDFDEIVIDMRTGKILFKNARILVAEMECGNEIVDGSFLHVCGMCCTMEIQVVE